MRLTTLKLVFILVTWQSILSIGPCLAQSGFRVETAPNVSSSGFFNADNSLGDFFQMPELSADGRVMAVFDMDLKGVSTTLWDVSTGRPLRTLRHSTYFTKMLFLHNGTQLATGHEDGTVIIWDIALGKEIATFKAGNDEITSLWADEAGDWLVAGDASGRVTLWSIRQKKLTFSVDNVVNDDHVEAAHFAHAKDRLIILYAKKAVIYDLNTKRVVFSYAVPTVANGEYSIIPSNIRDDVLLLKLKPADCQIPHLMLLSVDRDTEPRKLEEAPGCKGRDNNDDFGSLQLFTSPTGKTLIWRQGIPGMKALNLDTMLLEPAPAPFSAVDTKDLVGLFPEQRLAVERSEGDKLRIYNFERHALISELHRFGTGVARVVRSEDTHSIVFALKQSRGEPDQKELIVWDIESPVPKVLQLRGMEATIYDYAPKLNLALGATENGEMVFLSTETRRETNRFSVAGFKTVDKASLSPDGKMIAVLGRDDSNQAIAALVRARDGAIQSCLERAGYVGHPLSKCAPNEVALLAFSPDSSKVAIGREEGSIEIWSTQTFQRIRAAENNERRLSSFTISRDGKYLIAGVPDADTVIELWDIESLHLIKSFLGKDEWSYVVFTSVAMSADGKMIVGGVRNRARSSGDLNRELGVKVYDRDTGKLRFNLEGHVADVDAVAFSPDDKWIISASRDGTIIYWDRISGKRIATFMSGENGRWIIITNDGFFAGTPQSNDLLSVVRGLEVTSMDQLHQSLFSPDLVRETIAHDPDGDVRAAVQHANLGSIIDSGPPPFVEIASPLSGGKSDTDLVTVAARIKDRGKGIGRIEWRVNGITVGVCHPPQPQCPGPENEVKRELALDSGENVIEAVAYNKGDLLASLPAQTRITYTGPADTVGPKLYVLAIGINTYHDDGQTLSGKTSDEYFPPLTLAVDDAKSIATELKEAARGLYSEVHVRTALDEEATRAGLDGAVREVAAEINPRDTFVLFAAAHGDSEDGRFYLIPYDYRGGDDPATLRVRAIGQDVLQDWIANRIRAKKALILLDTCQSGALTNGYAHSRVSGPASEAAIGRLHEATGRPVLTAAAANQDAIEGVRDKTGKLHGVFTWALLQALKNGDTNHNGLIELSELVAYVQNEVPDIAHDVQARAVTSSGSMFGIQTPRFGSTGGDFPLVHSLRDVPNATAALPSAAPAPDEVAWNLVKDTHDSDQVSRFIAQFPRSAHLVEAAEKLAALQQHPVEAATDIAKKLQIELRRVGCFAADPDGDWNAGSIRALELFNRYSGSSLDTKLASLDALEAVRSKPVRICPLICHSGYHADGDQCVPTMHQRYQEHHYRAEQRVWRYKPRLPSGVKIGCPPAVQPCQ